MCFFVTNQYIKYNIPFFIYTKSWICKGRKLDNALNINIIKASYSMVVIQQSFRANLPKTSQHKNTADHKHHLATFF
jgi:hypothetical protein